VRVHIVDPSAYTPPYDHGLCRALGLAGADVELYTSRFAYAQIAPADGYLRRESFYRLAARVPDARVRRIVKLAEHVPDMLRYRSAAAAADVVHFQWLTVQHLDRHLLPGRRTRSGARRPLLLSAHDILPREPRRGQREAQRRLYEHFDAVIVHSEHGRLRLISELAVDPERVHVIEHGVLEHLAEDQIGVAHSQPPFQTEKPVVLFLGLLRPYKGLDVLLEAWRGIEDAELWIAGMPRMDISALRADAPPGVRFAARFIGPDELPAFFRRADLVVLPYREIDQSGVLFTALAFERPLLLSDVGGFPEIARAGAARTFPSGDAPALHAAILELLGDAPARAQLVEGARALARGAYSWDAVARRTLALYESLLGEGGAAS
jgi:glycosyltransferase involved in cell wall biosynthesis